MKLDNNWLPPKGMTVCKNYRNDPNNGETVVGDAQLGTVGPRFWVGEDHQFAPALPLKVIGELWHTGWDIPTNYAIDDNNNSYKDSAHGGNLYPCKVEELLGDAEAVADKNKIRKILGLEAEKTIEELYRDALNRANLAETRLTELSKETDTLRSRVYAQDAALRETLRYNYKYMVEDGYNGCLDSVAAEAYSKAMKEREKP